MSKKQVSSVESIGRHDFMDFYKTGKNPEVKMERGVPALTFHFFVFFQFGKKPGI